MKLVKNVKLIVVTDEIKSFVAAFEAQQAQKEQKKTLAQRVEKVEYNFGLVVKQAINLKKQLQ